MDAKSLGVGQPSYRLSTKPAEERALAGSEEFGLSLNAAAEQPPAEDRAKGPAAAQSDLGYGQIGIDLENGKIKRVEFYAADGTKLTTSGFNPEALLRLTQKFDIPMSDLNGLADVLDAAEVGYKPYELYPGTGSDHGIDLRDLASGGLGTAYDWREDAQVGLKGKYAAARLDASKDLAEQLGLTLNPEVTTNRGLDVSRLTPLMGGDGVMRSHVAVGGNVASWHSSAADAQAAAQRWLSGYMLNLGK